MNAQLQPAPRKRVLLLGSGSSHDKRMVFPESPEKNFSGFDMVTCDIDPDLNPAPDVVWNLDCLPYTFAADDEFDEIHAYEVLEHCGTQGDGAYFFAQFAEFWRMLKPNGFMCISVPCWDMESAWGVPDHKRVLPPNVFGFLNPSYYDNVGKPGFADYRKWLGKTHFQPFARQEKGDSNYIVLRAIK